MPWDWSDAVDGLLLRDHTAVTRVNVLHSDTPSYVLEATGGGVSMDASRPVRGNLSCNLVDPTGNLSRGDIDDLLDPYECEIAPWRGVRYRDPVTGLWVEELAPLGVYALTGRAVADSTDGLAISLTGQDRAITYQGPMDSALAISAGTPVEDAVAALLVRRNSRLAFQALVTGYTCGPLVYAPDIDVWKEAQDLAESVGARLFHDRTGQAVLALAGPASDRPAAVYAEGDGLLLDVNRQEDSDTIRNVVVAENTAGTVRAVAEDADPASPTFAGGKYGRRVTTIVNQHFGSVQQAQQAATTRLAWELGRSETVDFTCVPNPGRDVEEVVAVHRPRAGLDRRAVVVATLDIPLTATDPMRVGCRQSRLAPDGEVLSGTAPA